MAAARLARGNLIRPSQRYSTDHGLDENDIDWPRRLKAVVEIVPVHDGTLPKNLLRTVYRASQGGVIALALTDVTAAVVDKVMDDIVPLFPLNIPGIRYIDTENQSMLARIICRADVAFGDTILFRRIALEAGFEPPLPFSWQFGGGNGPASSSAHASWPSPTASPTILSGRIFAEYPLCRGDAEAFKSETSR